MINIIVATADYCKHVGGYTSAVNNGGPHTVKTRSQNVAVTDPVFCKQILFLLRVHCGVLLPAIREQTFTYLKRGGLWTKFKQKT